MELDMDLFNKVMNVAYAAFVYAKSLILSDNYTATEKEAGVLCGADELHLIAIGKHDAVLCAKSAGYWAARIRYDDDALKDYFELQLEDAICNIATIIGNNKIDEINIFFTNAMQEILSFE